MVSTHKSASMEGLKLLLLERIDAVSLKGKGEYVVGIDSVGANAGEVVFFVTGSSARILSSGMLGGFIVLSDLIRVMHDTP